MPPPYGGAQMLVFAALMLAQATAAPLVQKRVNLSETLYYASIAATGSRLCDRDRSARYTAQFNERYGERVRRLLGFHDATVGPDSDFIITSSCTIPRKSGRGQDRDHAIALDRFETTLRKLEREFGPVGAG
jgi:hypothetical protein